MFNILLLQWFYRRKVKGMKKNIQKCKQNQLKYNKKNIKSHNLTVNAPSTFIIENVKLFAVCRRTKEWIKREKEKIVSAWYSLKSHRNVYMHKLLYYRPHKQHFYLFLFFFHFLFSLHIQIVVVFGITARELWIKSLLLF